MNPMSSIFFQRNSAELLIKFDKHWRVPSSRRQIDWRTSHTFFIGLTFIIIFVSNIDQYSAQGVLTSKVNETWNQGRHEAPTNTTPHWWTFYKRPRPTLAPHDYPRGIGVATWKAVDIYEPESRKGRSFARSEATKSESNLQAVPHFIQIIFSGLISSLAALFMFS